MRNSNLRKRRQREWRRRSFNTKKTNNKEKWRENQWKGIQKEYEEGILRYMAVWRLWGQWPIYKCGSSVLYVQISIISSIQDTEVVLKGVEDVLTNYCWFNCIFIDNFDHVNTALLHFICNWHILVKSKPYEDVLFCSILLLITLST